MDYRPPGSSVHGILQARVLSGLPIPSPGDLPDPGTAWQVDSLPLSHEGSRVRVCVCVCVCVCVSDDFQPRALAAVNIQVNVSFQI